MHFFASPLQKENQKNKILLTTLILSHHWSQYNTFNINTPKALKLSPGLTIHPHTRQWVSITWYMCAVITLMILGPLSNLLLKVIFSQRWIPWLKDSGPCAIWTDMKGPRKPCEWLYSSQWKAHCVLEKQAGQQGHQTSWALSMAKRGRLWL